jgi:YbgC/YbaW family acyl-CoA thioester hydrolase
MAYEFKTQRIVEFAETDMAGILHFSNYFRYMEAAEHAFFRSLGLSVHSGADSGACGAARLEAECSFRRPLCYEDVVDLHLLVKEKRTRSITYQVVFRKDGEEVARGSMAVVFVSKVKGDGSLEAVPIPPEADALIEVAPAELL